MCYAARSDEIQANCFFAVDNAMKHDPYLEFYVFIWAGNKCFQTYTMRIEVMSYSESCVTLPKNVSSESN